MCLYIILLLPLLLSDSAPPYFMDFSSSRQQSLNVHCFTNKITPTLESGINVPLCLLIFGIFSRCYGLNTDLKYLKFTTYIRLHILRGYIYSFCQIFQRLRLFKGLRLFRTLEYYRDAVRFSSPGGVSDNPIPTARGQVMPTALVLAQPDLNT